jgi:predicted GNAT superfamily acetyltransferase
MTNSLSFYYPKKDKISDDLLERILQLNQFNTPALGSLKNIDHLKELYFFSKFILVVKNKKSLIGFAVVMDGNSEYQSLNYKYFKKRFGSSFLYIDRVAVHSDFQNKSVGSLIYKHVYSISLAIPFPLCCEVNTVPLNTQSLNFHKKMEFHKIDEIPFGEKRVAMLVKD